jgi:trehalose 6-phosphate phosphatase
VLASLARTWRRVAVVSGRPVAYLADRLAGAGSVELYGLYGLERSVPGSDEVQVQPAAEGWRLAVEQAAAEAERRLPPGVTVERKGLAVTLHYRRAPRSAEATTRLAASLEDTTGLSAHKGKMSVELRPPVEVDKGAILRREASGLAAVLFAGDDLGDLPAFAELRRLRAGGAATLGVVAGSAETPAEVVAAADLVVDGPAGVVELLGRLVEG